MSQSEDYQRFIQKLTDIFQLINDWLKYAEAKSAVTLTFDGVAMTIIITYLSTIQKIPNSIYIGSLISIIFLFISSVICIVSFLPQMDLEKSLIKIFHSSTSSENQPKDTDVLIFYGHLRKYAGNENREVNVNPLIERIKNDYFSDVPASDDFNTKESGDLGKQIIINSSITYRKFLLGTWSILALFLAAISFPASILTSLIFNHSL